MAANNAINTAQETVHIALTSTTNQKNDFTDRIEFSIWLHEQIITRCDSELSIKIRQKMVDAGCGDLTWENLFEYVAAFFPRKKC